jgi:hypothetical protein
MSDTVSFCLPPGDWPSEEVLSEGTSGMGRTFKSSDWMWNTHWHWTLQTYLWLRESGCPVRLSKGVPDEGIVVACRGLVPSDLRPGPGLFLVSINGDESPHPYAQINVMQNRIQTRLVSDSHYVPFWPQPGITGRDPARGDRFDSIAFFGDDKNIAPELGGEDWSAFLASRGIQWHVRNAQSDRNTDFSDVDGVIGIRSFRRTGYIRKPASKLVNAWIAGSPAILGRELAFQEQRRNAADYVEVSTFAQTCEAIDRLAASPDLRRSMAANGLSRAREFTVPLITEAWRHLLFDVAQKSLARWSGRSAASRRLFFLRRELEKKARGTAHRILRSLDKEQLAI